MTEFVCQILKDHYTVTYGSTNFVFPLLCVSLAYVDFWVNGGWDQPNCGISANPWFFVLFLSNLNFTGKIYNFFII
jgi:hypothetical protein